MEVCVCGSVAENKELMTSSNKTMNRSGVGLILNLNHYSSDSPILSWDDLSDAADWPMCSW